MAAAMQAPKGAHWNDELIEIYREHYPALVRTAKRAVHSHAIAEEVVHDAFVTFHLRDCKPKPGRELAYLRTMVVNRGHTVTRRKIRGEELTVPDWFSDPTVEDRALAGFDAEAVRGAVADLPSRQQQVLTLRYQHGLSEAEIAEALGISRGSVKTHAMRGRAALRVALLPMI